MSRAGEIESVLDALMSSPSRPLWGYSQLKDKPGQPFQVRLRADALSVAEELHQRFGTNVELEVGLFSYPHINVRPRRLPSRTKWPVADEQSDFICELDGPLTVASGKTVRHGLLLTSAIRRPVDVNTNGGLTAFITDPVDGHDVGGFVGAQTMGLVTFTLTYGRTVRIPLLAGTASFDSGLGYTVPPGQWTHRAEVQLSDGRCLNTPPLPVTVTR